MTTMPNKRYDKWRELPTDKKFEAVETIDKLIEAETKKIELLGELRYALVSEWIKATPAGKHDWNSSRGLAKADIARLYLNYRKAEHLGKEMFTFRKDRFTVKFAKLLIYYIEHKHGNDSDYMADMRAARGEFSSWKRRREELTR